MKTALSLLLVASLYGSAATYAQTGEFLNLAFPFADTTTSYQLYVPANYTGTEPWPLILNLHGFGSGPGIQAFTSQMNEAADTMNYLVAYPDGKLIPGPDGTEGVGWNADWWRGRDDLNALSTVIDHVWTNYAVDLTRVYAIGLDNGGQMALALGCALDDRITAVGGVAIPFTPQQIENCMPSRPIPNLFMHGTDDLLTPFTGIPGFVLGAQELAESWAAKNSCSPDPMVTPLPDIDTEDGSTVMLSVYEQCTEDAEVHFYETMGGGHTWSDGPPVPLGFEILGNVNRDVNTSGELLAFFERFTHPGPRPGSFVEDATDDVLDFSIDVDGVERTYALYVPPTYDGASDWPLLVVLHSFATRSRFQLTTSGILPIADREEFIVVAPQGLIRDGLDDTGEGWNIELRDDLADDVGFIDALLDELTAMYVIDQRRVYAAGFSQGAGMTYQIANSFPDRIAAIAAVSSALPSPETREFAPSRPIPLLQIHGTADTIARYDQPSDRFIPFTSVLETIEIWRSINGCTDEATITDFPDLVTTDESTVTRIAYTNCTTDAPVVHFRVNGGGHSWPGSVSSLGFSGTPNQDISASEEIWDFLSQYQLPVQEGFSLLDAATDTPIPSFNPLVPGAVLDANTLPSDLNITASFDDAEIAKVIFTLNGTDVRTEYVAPYALFGDAGGDFAPGTLPVGAHVLQATAYDTQGAALKTLTTAFTVDDGSAPAILGMVLVDADSNGDLSNLIDGQALNLGDLPGALNVRAEVNNLVQSVAFDLNGGTYQRLETIAPFALFGDLGGDYLRGSFATGTNTITVTPYAGPNGTGDAGEARTLTLNIQGSASKQAGLTGRFIEGAGQQVASSEAPASFALDANYPNPFNPSTTIRFTLPEQADVHLAVYDMLGRRVATLQDGPLNVGTHNIVFDATNLPSGVYLYRLVTPAGSFSQHMTLLK